MTNLKYDLCIIIPAYDAKETINKTLESIKNQKLDIKFEVIIVNDCSKYSYKNFIDKYKKYYNIREIKTKVNSGPGVARQLGIDISNSKYIVFIDSDDVFYDKYSVAKMYGVIDKSGVDLVIFNFLYQKKGQKLIKREDSNWLHGKIYKRNFLIKNNIKFNNTRANEDNGFNKLILFLNPKYIIVDELVYIYRENSKSITSKDNNIYRFNGIEGFCYNMNWAMEEAVLRNVSEDKFTFFSLNVLASLYIYYLSFYNEFPVKNILIWGKNIKNVYDRCKIKIPIDLVNKIVEMRKKELSKIYKNNKINLSFAQFLELF